MSGGAFVEKLVRALVKEPRARLEAAELPGHVFVALDEGLEGLCHVYDLVVLSEDVAVGRCCQGDPALEHPVRTWLSDLVSDFGLTFGMHEQDPNLREARRRVTNRSVRL